MGAVNPTDPIFPEQGIISPAHVEVYVIIGKDPKKALNDGPHLRLFHRTHAPHNIDPKDVS